MGHPSFPRCCLCRRPRRPIRTTLPPCPTSMPTPGVTPTTATATETPPAAPRRRPGKRSRDPIPRKPRPTVRFRRDGKLAVYTLRAARARAVDGRRCLVSRSGRMKKRRSETATGDHVAAAWDKWRAGSGQPRHCRQWAPRKFACQGANIRVPIARWEMPRTAGAATVVAICSGNSNEKRVNLGEVFFRSF